MSHEQHIIKTPLQYERLKLTLPFLFGDLDEESFHRMEPLLSFEWFELPGNQTLFDQGDIGDSLYIVISGRLGAYIKQSNTTQFVGEITRGETVGEMSIFTGEPRSATIVALRDSILAKLSKSAFQKLVENFPSLSSQVTKLIVERLRRQYSQHKKTPKVVNIAIIPISNAVDKKSFSAQFHEQMLKFGNTILLNRHEVNKHFDTVTNIVDTQKENDLQTYRSLTQWLDEQEARHDFVIYEGNTVNSEWTRRCIRQADEILLLADAHDSPDLSEVEKLLGETNAIGQTRKRLILLHSEETHLPSHTARWLHPRSNITLWHHARHQNKLDIARIARFLSGNAVGLVLAGGGARGLAHIGVFRALEEEGIQIDAIGGTSFGALVAARIALGVTAKQVFQDGKKYLSQSPTDDYNLIPLISLVRGGKIKKIVDDLFGNTHLEDTWIPSFVVSSNMTKSEEKVHRQGLLKKAIRASTALPGIFPPVVMDHDLLVDGCIFNNMPVDVMADQMGVSKVIAVDLYTEKQNQTLNFEEIPSGWAMLKDKFTNAKNKKYRIPTLMTSMMAANLMCSNFKSIQFRKQVDLLFNPRLKGIGLLDWKKFEKIVELGYDHAKEVIKHDGEKLLNKNNSA